MDPELIFFILCSLSLGICIGFFAFWSYQRIQLGTFRKLADEIVKGAEKEADALRNDAIVRAHQEQQEQKKESEKELIKDRKRLLQEQQRLTEREDKLDRRMGLVERKLSDIEKRETTLIAKKEQLDEESKSIQNEKDRLFKEFEKLTGLSFQEAKDLFMSHIAQESQAEAANHSRKIQKEAEEEAERRASSIIATAINRLSVACVSEATVTTVSLPSDEMKGRIIGREGRNIRALERATGVNFLIDDTPGVVVISGFDPVRKEIARKALLDLIEDGRIHPTRIEETVESASQKIDQMIKQYGEDAATRVGAIDLHPELIKLLGKLKFRFSYGQNVLDHSLEVAHLMGIMANELNLNSALAKRIGLLHDVGKAMSHEIEGTHAIIGHDFAKKYGESDEVANGIGCHHEEMEPITIEGTLCSAGDRLSASRPGARIEAIEEYIKRLRKLEQLAYEFPGIDKAYAMQAGREIRIIVLPDMVDDQGASTLAKDLSRRIEEQMSYPGKIKVTVIRERRIVDYAQ